MQPLISVDLTGLEAEVALEIMGPALKARALSCTLWTSEKQGGLRGLACRSCCVYFIKENFSFLISLIHTKGSLTKAALWWCGWDAFPAWNPAVVNNTAECANRELKKAL